MPQVQALKDHVSPDGTSRRAGEVYAVLSSQDAARLVRQGLIRMRPARRPKETK